MFQGDICSNITIAAPSLAIDQAWEAAEVAGIADDIRARPMGMYTMISEGSGGISGGQRQRLMIARAVAPKPRILLFDEATSALDNLTQKKVSDALGGLKCARIVIAHRLSAIRQCGRIIVLIKEKLRRTESTMSCWRKTASLRNWPRGSGWRVWGVRERRVDFNYGYKGGIAEEGFFVRLMERDSMLKKPHEQASDQPIKTKERLQ